MYPPRVPGVMANSIAEAVGGWPFANIITVSTTDPDADHSTIAAAVTAANAGDIIRVDPGTYTEDITIDKKLVLLSQSAELVTITNSINITGDSVVVDGVTVLNTSGSSGQCIGVTGDNVVIRNCIQIKTSGTPVQSVGISNNGGANLRIENNRATITSASSVSYGFATQAAASDTKIIGGEWEGTTSDIFASRSGASVDLDNPTLTNGNVGGTLGTITGSFRGAIMVKNSSGATANQGDIGYIDEAGEYQTTTTEADNVAWCVVHVGYRDTENIFIKRQGDTIANYTGAAPNTGDFLTTSTVAGLALASATMRPEIFAVCTANGAGGTVAVLLLTGESTRYFNSANDILRINSSSDSDFVATINGAPVGAAVVYNAPSSGAEDTIVPSVSTQEGKIVLHNTTRGDSALISSVNTGTNTITLTAAAPGAWANGDTITTRSQTATGVVLFSERFYDLELTGLATELLLARVLIVELLSRDTSIDSTSFNALFNFDTFTLFTEMAAMFPQVNSAFLSRHVEVGLLENKLCFTVGAGGASTADIIVRVKGAIYASP